MTIEPIHVYGLIVAQKYIELFTAFGIIGISCALVSFFIMAFAAQSYDYPEDETIPKWTKVNCVTLVVSILLIATTPLIPSWKDLALIYGVPAAYNGSEVVLNDIGKQYPRVKKLIEAKLDEALGEEVE